MADKTFTATAVVPSANAVFKHGLCGVAAVTAMQPVRKDPATKTWIKAQGNSLAGAKAEGVAAHAASPGQPLAVIESDPALAVGATITEGTRLAVSPANAGGVIDATDLTTGNFPCVFGIMLDGGVTAKVDFLNELRTDSAMP